MKINKSLVAASLFALPLLVGGTVSAVANENSRDDSVRQSTPAAVLAQNTEQARTQLSAEDKADVKRRVDQLKANLKIRLTTAEKQRIQTKCTNAQGSVSSLSGKVKGIETSREQVYSNLTDRLTKLKDRLDDKGADVAELEKHLTALELLITTYKNDLAAYKDALEVLSAQECKTDPEGFKAALENARTAAKKVREDVKTIRAHVNDTIKPTLKTIRDSLVQESQEGSE